jgi:hypothetical protein
VPSDLHLEPEVQGWSPSEFLQALPCRTRTPELLESATWLQLGSEN